MLNKKLISIQKLQNNQKNLLKSYQGNYNFHDTLIESTKMIAMNVSQLSLDFGRVGYFGYFPEVYLSNIDKETFQNIKQFTIFNTYEPLAQYQQQYIQKLYPDLKLNTQIILEEDLKNQNEFDLLISNFNLHLNDKIQEGLKSIQKALVNDGCIIGHLPVSNCFLELRNCYYTAQQKMFNGYSQKVQRFPAAQKFSNILYLQDWQMASMVKEHQKLDFDSLYKFVLMLKKHGMNSVLNNISQEREYDLFKLTNKIYKENYGNSYTLEYVRFIGYKHDEQQLFKKKPKEFDMRAFGEYLQQQKDEGQNIKIGYIDQDGTIFEREEEGKDKKVQLKFNHINIYLMNKKFIKI